MRLFLSIALADSIKNSIKSYQKRLDEIIFTTIPAVKLHLTLYFLGEVEEKNLESLKNVLRVLFSQTKSFDLSFEKFTLAPPGREATMVWAQYGTNLSFVDLVKNITEALDPFTMQKKMFDKPIAHINIARVRPGKLPKQFELPAADRLGELHISGCELVHSTLGQDGSLHTTIDRYRFN